MRKVKNGMGTWLAVFDQDGDVVASISKRPDHRPIEQILDEHGDEIFQDADSVVIEIDIDKEIVKKTFHYAEKYGKSIRLYRMRPLQLKDVTLDSLLCMQPAGSGHPVF